LREFKLLDHTADIGIKAYGETLEKLFGNAASGMFSIITDLDKVKSSRNFYIQVKGEDEENLLIKWLNELLYLFDTEYCLFNRFDIKINEVSDYNSYKEKSYELKNNKECKEIKNNCHCEEFNRLLSLRATRGGVAISLGTGCAISNESDKKINKFNNSSKHKENGENKKLLLKAVALGEKVDLKKHPIKISIKGATYHKLEIKKNKKFTASIFFDV